jgi:hypothetical protein
MTKSAKRSSAKSKTKAPKVQTLADVLGLGRKIEMPKAKGTKENPYPEHGPVTPYFVEKTKAKVQINRVKDQQADTFNAFVGKWLQKPKKAKATKKPSKGKEETRDE